MSLTHLSLFSGIGGLDMAAEWAGIETIGQCEWAEYPTKVLEKHWPNVPRWKDIRTLTGDDFYERTGRRTVDIISGGFPCQPFSVAGKQRGKEDDRYLWPEMVRVIKELRPTWVVGENVAGIVRMALPDILSELEGCGYRTRTFLIPACAVGARHRRYRVAVVGYSEHNGLSSTAVAGSVEKTGGGEQERKETAGESPGASKPGNSKAVGRAQNLENTGCIGFGKQGSVCEQPRGAEFERTSETLANTESKFERRLSVGEEPEKPGLVSGCENVGHTYGAGLQTERTKQQPTRASRTGKNVQYSDSAGRKKQYTAAQPNKTRLTGWRYSERKNESREWATESIMDRMANGLPDWMDGDLDFIINHYWDDEPDIPRIATGVEHRVDRLKCLGNAVVPQQFYPIFKAIAITMALHGV